MASPPNVRYIENFPGLLADAPPGHPHIIDLEDFRDEEKQHLFTIVDVAVTILYNYDKLALKAFLDPIRQEYVFWRYNRGSEFDFAIHRRQRTLFLGLRNQEPVVEWVCAAECRLSNFGDWLPVAYLGMDGQREEAPQKVFETFEKIIGYACDDGNELWKKPENGSIEAAFHRLN